MQIATGLTGGPPTQTLPNRAEEKAFAVRCKLQLAED
jgi:hypothetical protein